MAQCTHRDTPQSSDWLLDLSPHCAAIWGNHLWHKKKRVPQRSLSRNSNGLGCSVVANCSAVRRRPEMHLYAGKGLTPLVEVT